MDRTMAGLVLVVVILMAGVGGISTQFERSVTEGVDQTAVNDEAFTVTNGTLHTFAESNRDVVYNETVTVVDTSGSSDVVVQPSGNYTWYEKNGTLFVFQDANQFNSGDSATIDYQYHVPTEKQRAVRDVGLIATEDLGDTIPLIFGVALLIGSLAVLRRSQ